MQKKIIVAAEILLIIGLSFYYVFKTVIPEYKKSLGSSDKFVSLTNYNSIIELKIDDNVNFMILINTENKIYHIFFLNKEAFCIYNKNIENKSIKEALNSIVKELINSKYLKDFSTINITKYTDNNYDTVKKELENVLNKTNLNVNLIETTNTLINKSKELNLNATEDLESILRTMDLYSKDIMNTVKKHTETTSTIDSTNSKTYTNNIYKKLEEYTIKNNIKNQEINSPELSIYLIPADSDGKYYPTTNSWYYIKDSKVYAYIELTDNDKSYSYCYNGSIDLNKEGEC